MMFHHVPPSNNSSNDRAVEVTVDLVFYKKYGGVYQYAFKINHKSTSIEYTNFKFVVMV